MRKRFAFLLAAIVAATGLMFVGTNAASAAVGYAPATNNHEYVQTCDGPSGHQEMKWNYTITAGSVTGTGGLQRQHWSFQLNSLDFTGVNSLYDFQASITSNGYDGSASTLWRNPATGSTSTNTPWPHGFAGGNPSAPTAIIINGINATFTAVDITTPGAGNTDPNNEDPLYIKSAFRNKIGSAPVTLDCGDLRFALHLPDSLPDSGTMTGIQTCQAFNPGFVPSFTDYRMEFTYQAQPLLTAPGADFYSVQLTGVEFYGEPVPPLNAPVSYPHDGGIDITVTGSDGDTQNLNSNSTNWHPDTPDLMENFQEYQGIDGIDFPGRVVRMTPGASLRPSIQVQFGLDSGVTELDGSCTSEDPTYITRTSGWGPIGENPNVETSQIFDDCSSELGGAVRVNSQWEKVRQNNVDFTRIVSLTIKNDSLSTIKFDQGTANTNVGVYLTEDGFDRVTSYKGSSTGDRTIAAGVTKTFKVSQNNLWKQTSDTAINYDLSPSQQAPREIAQPNTGDIVPTINVNLRAYNGSTLCDTGSDLDSIISSSNYNGAVHES